MRAAGAAADQKNRVAAWWARMQDELPDDAFAEQDYLNARLHIPLRRGSLVRSGYRLLTSADILQDYPHDDRGYIERLAARVMQRGDNVVLVPLRSALDGVPCNLLHRFLDDGDPHQITLKGAPMHDRWAPLGIGAPAEALSANVLVLCRGADDTLLAEALLHDAPGCRVVGAIDDAHMIERWATWLAKKARRGWVVIVYGRNDDGRAAALDCLNKLHDNKVPARALDWYRLLSLRDGETQSLCALPDEIQPGAWSDMQRAFKDAINDTIQG